MSDDIQKQLEEAFDLIQAEKLDEATAILKPFLKENPKNADAWWLLANTVDEPREARQALVNVLKYDPGHRQAQDMLDKLNEAFPPRDDELMFMMEAHDARQDDDLFSEELMSDDELFKVFEGESDLDLDALDELEKKIDKDDTGVEETPFDEIVEKKRVTPVGREAPRTRRSLLRPVLLVASAAVIATVLFAISNNSNKNENKTGAVDLGALVAEEPPTPELAAVIDTIQNDARNQFGESSTALFTHATQGPSAAVFVNTCVCLTSTCDGPRVDELSRIIMDGLMLIASRVSEANLAEVAPVAGINVQTCGEKPDVVYRAFTSVENAARYENDANLEAFRANWTVVEG